MDTQHPKLEIAAPQGLIDAFEQAAAQRQCSTNEIIVEAMGKWLTGNDRLAEIESELRRLKDDMRDQKDDFRDLKDDFRDLKDDVLKRDSAS